MSENIPFYNWSLSKILSTIPDSFDKAKVKILYVILIFSLVKIFVIIPIVINHSQFLHLERSLIMLVVYIVLLKLLLSNKKFISIISHIMAWMGLILIWSILFVFAQTINILSLQFIFMLILSCFYLLNRNSGIFYSVLSIIPVIIFMIEGNSLSLNNLPGNELSSPGYEILVILNFITVVVAHFLYHQAFSNNIAEKVSLNEQLQIAVKEANIAAQSKSDFLSTMSHELRTPLNSVIGMAELLKDEPHSVEQDENLQILNFSAASLYSLINDILDFNKLGSEKLYLETVSVNLSALMNDICAGMRVQAKEKGLNLILEMDVGIKDLHIFTDPTRLSQIIYNLTGNAIKFTPLGSVTVGLKLIERDSENIFIRFSVLDTGIGINIENQQVIFEPFIQASTSTTRNFGGTGLGLAIVNRLLILFKSKINMESSQGEGSNFYFDIPFKLDISPVEMRNANGELEYDLRGLRVLVVEDNPINSLLLKKVLTKWKNIPDFAKNGQEALDKLVSDRYDVILMDIHMPVLDGYETTRQIRLLPDAFKSKIPVIALTASVSNNLYEKIKSAGMNDYVNKPFNSKELYTKLKEIYQKKN